MTDKLLRYFVSPVSVDKRESDFVKIIACSDSRTFKSVIPCDNVTFKSVIPCADSRTFKSVIPWANYVTFKGVILCADSRTLIHACHSLR